MVYMGMMMALICWGEEYTQAIETYSYLHQRMFYEGWFEYSETGEFIVHEAFRNWAGREDYISCLDRWQECSSRIAQYTNADDIPESLVTEYTQIVQELNGYLAEFLGTSVDQIPVDVPDTTAVADDEPADQASFSTANIIAEGDASAIDRVRFPLQNIQSLYDTIARHLESGGYSLAQRNIDNLSASLSSLEAEVTDLRSRHSISITFHGLPSDEAMRAYREMEEQRDRNYTLWEYAQKTMQDLDAALLESNLSYITTVWRTAYQSMLDWHSPPDWYEVPQTFYGWYQDSEERAGIIMEIVQAIQRLQVARSEFDRIRTTALDTHGEILERLEEAGSVPDIDSQLRGLIGGLGWAGFEDRSD
ncbi:MAG: hypothetical protein JXK93_08560 [Sphaerochaetaceae bacterium]|nr:hypothetical protein [Sphaerochaetaceae bacterium]